MAYVLAMYQSGVKIPLTYSDAVSMAEAAVTHGAQIDAVAKALMAVDVASRADQKALCHDLIGDVFDMLVRVREYVDDRADADFDGEDYVPNEAMRILGALDDSYNGKGLLTRVEAAWNQTRERVA